MRLLLAERLERTKSIVPLSGLLGFYGEGQLCAIFEVLGNG
jgi:hypothetical protein